MPKVSFDLVVARPDQAESDPRINKKFYLVLFFILAYFIYIFPVPPILVSKGAETSNAGFNPLGLIAEFHLCVRLRY